ncbi:type IV secretory system conjugative DNA transfer family protein [Streptomyces sp. NRRL S-87]|uniref:type IV secretory system conjugative DNA transfer family protein n=1 Tax=Streptomyces sp. NRRL S-87 TaxID=1463920 RepID=UPI001F19577B|nr:type IV secretory system conjugative DNA transfer family protein [Streptomyces sp. NRRL S-87]
MVWSATGLAALFARGAWPAGVTFTRTPMALHALLTAPHDLARAWPHTDPAALSGWGLFWGILVSELLVLFVLTVFAIGVLARTKARRARIRAERQHPKDPVPAPTHDPGPGPGPGPVEPPARTSPEPAAVRPSAPRTSDAPTAAAPDADHVPVPTAPADPADPATEPAPAPEPAAPAPTPRREPPAPRSEPTQDAYRYGFGYAPRSTAPADPRSADPQSAHPQPVAPHADPAPGARLAYAAPADRRRAAAHRIAEAEGAVLVVTSSPALWAETKDARAKLGPVLLYDPSHLCDTPARMHWHPGTGCTDRDTAASRAIALLAPVRPQSRIDAAVADTAETLLRSWLHAAALDDRPFKQLHRWALGSAAHEPVRILRTHPKAAPGTAGELENALTAHPERREIAQELTARALSALSSIHIRESCTPNRTDSLTLASFADEGGTLYLVGEPVEDPRTSPGAMPLLTALASSVVEYGRRVAVRSSAGRLGPPLTLVLDDVAAVAPIPQLPELLADSGPAALPVLALLRSREQARSRWPALASEALL